MKKGTAFICLYLMLATQLVTGKNSSLMTNSPDSTENDEVKISLNADLVSRYIWRGIPQCSNPSIQPYGSFEKGNFSFGTWASYGIAEPYAEIDLFLSYTLGNVTFTINDYYNEDETNYTFYDYFNWENDGTTSHILEGVISYEGPEDLPITVTTATFLYGNDKKDLIANKNYYSTYIEVGYAVKWGENEVKFFAGGTPAEGYYSQKAAIVNAGFSVSKNLKINDDLGIPLNASFIINPDRQDVYFVVGITI